MGTKLYSVAGTAERLGVGRSTTFELIKSGELQSVKLRGRRLVSDSAIADYIERLTAAGK